MVKITLESGLEIEADILGNPLRDLEDTIAAASSMDLKPGSISCLNGQDGYLQLISSNGAPLNKDYGIISIKGSNGKIQYLIVEQP